MDQPKNLDPEAWAKYNHHVALQAAGFRQNTYAEVPMSDIAIEVVELPEAVKDLTLAVRRAADELEGTSAKGDRIALQLLTALGRFARETGT